MLSKSFLQAVRTATFNPSQWTPVGDPVSLKEIWDTTSPGLYEKVSGDPEVICQEFSDGSLALRISVPLKDGSAIQLKLGSQSTLEEGDKVDLASITGQELTKVGSENIVRFDGEVKA